MWAQAGADAFGNPGNIVITSVALAMIVLAGRLFWRSVQESRVNAATDRQNILDRATGAEAERDSWRRHYLDLHAEVTRYIATGRSDEALGRLVSHLTHPSALAPPPALALPPAEEPPDDDTD